MVIFNSLLISTPPDVFVSEALCSLSSLSSPFFFFFVFPPRTMYLVHLYRVFYRTPFSNHEHTFHRWIVAVYCICTVRRAFLLIVSSNSTLEGRLLLEIFTGSERTPIIEHIIRLLMSAFRFRFLSALGSLYGRYLVMNFGIWKFDWSWEPSCFKLESDWNDGL